MNPLFILKLLLSNPNTMSNIFKLNIKDILGASASAVIVAVLVYIGNSADIFSIDLKEVLNIALATFVTSLVKAFSTDSEGKLLGYIKVK